MKIRNLGESRNETPVPDWLDFENWTSPRLARKKLGDALLFVAQQRMVTYRKILQVLEGELDVAFFHTRIACHPAH